MNSKQKLTVVFIDPKGDQVGLNTGLAYLAAVLISAGHTVKVLDFNNYSKYEAKRLTAVKNADVVGISVKAFTMNESIRLAKEVKVLNPNAKLICGGAHLGTDGLNFMNENSEFDIGVIGDGEDAILDIVNNVPLSKINGIFYRDRKSNSVKSTASRELIQDLDRLPMPNYDCFDSLIEYSVPFPYNYYPLVSSRGCPCNCLYCSVPLLSGKKWRAHSAERVIEELEIMTKKWRLKEFAPVDDNFTVDLSRAKKICKLLIDKQLNLKWQCPNGIKAQFTDLELAQLMSKSGVFQVNIGIESAVPEVFNKIGKGGTLDHIKTAIKNYKSTGIKVAGFFLIGLPDSSYELDKLSLKLSGELGLDIRIWSFVTPYPGTKLFSLLQTDAKNFTVLDDWRKGQDFGRHPTPIFESKTYSAKQRKSMYYKANIKSKYYGAIIDMNSSNIRKALDVFTAIIKYDPLNIVPHSYWVGTGLALGIKNKTVKIGL